MNAKKLAALGLLGAISVVGAMLVHFSIFPQVSFLEYDPADIPIFITTFAMGTWYGLLLTVVVCVVQGLTVSAGSGILGIIMHILATGTFVITAGSIYGSHKTRGRAYASLAAGTMAWTLVMALWNLIITPIFMGVGRDVVWGLMPFIVLFNIIKAGINSVITALLYKRVHKQLDRLTK